MSPRMNQHTIKQYYLRFFFISRFPVCSLLTVIQISCVLITQAEHVHDPVTKSIIPQCPIRCTCTGSGGKPETVACRSLGLTTIPPNFPRGATRLDFSDNQLTEVNLSTLIGHGDGHMIGDVQSSAELILRSNHISKLINSNAYKEGNDGKDKHLMKEDSASTGRIVLDLSDNRLNGSLDSMVFQGFSSLLVTLDLSNNQLTDLGLALNGCHQLSRLDLRHNSLTGLDNLSFLSLSSLRYLRLDDNRISSIHQMAFSNLHQLSYITLKGNPIGDVIKERRLLFNTTFLSYVDMSECGLTTFPRGLPSTVRYLQLRRNNLTRLLRNDLADQRGPRVGGTGGGIGGGDERRGGTGGGPVGGHERGGGMVGQESGLEETSLGILVLDENVLDEIEDGTFDGLLQLQQLWLNGNRLKNVPCPLPVNLQRLLLDSNLIGGELGDHVNESQSEDSTMTSTLFRQGSALTTLSLMGNRLEGVSLRALADLTRLVDLDLGANLISNLRPGTFSANSRLQTLHLSKNPLRHLPLGCLDGLTSLKILSLAYLPPTTTANDEVFRDCAASLRNLDMDGSVSLIAHSIQYPTSTSTLFTPSRIPHHIPLLRHSDLQAGLNRLSMRKSDLTTLDQTFVKSFVNMTSFSVSSSRWYCDRRLVWLRDWLRKDHVTSKADGVINTCAMPLRLAGRALTSIGDTEWAVPTSDTVSELAVRTLGVITSTVANWMSTNRVERPQDRRADFYPVSDRTTIISITRDRLQDSNDDVSHDNHPKFANIDIDVLSTAPIFVTTNTDLSRSVFDQRADDEVEGRGAHHDMEDDAERLNASRDKNVNNTNSKRHPHHQDSAMLSKNHEKGDEGLDEEGEDGEEEEDDDDVTLHHRAVTTSFYVTSPPESSSTDTVMVVTVGVVAVTIVTAVFIVTLIVRLTCTTKSKKKNANKNTSNEVCRRETGADFQKNEDDNVNVDIEAELETLRNTQLLASRRDHLLNEKRIDDSLIISESLGRDEVLYCAPSSRNSRRFETSCDGQLRPCRMVAEKEGETPSDFEGWGSGNRRRSSTQLRQTGDVDTSERTDPRLRLGAITDLETAQSRRQGMNVADFNGGQCAFTGEDTFLGATSDMCRNLNAGNNLIESEIRVTDKRLPDSLRYRTDSISDKKTDVVSYSCNGDIGIRTVNTSRCQCGDSNSSDMNTAGPRQKLPACSNSRGSQTVTVGGANTHMEGAHPSLSNVNNSGPCSSSTVDDGLRIEETGAMSRNKFILPVGSAGNKSPRTGAMTAGTGNGCVAGHMGSALRVYQWEDLC